MSLPDISSLNIDPGDDSDPKLTAYINSLPYRTEPQSKMMEMLDFIILRIVQCVEAKDYEVGLLQWDSMLT